jgi:undecaprenyl-phosphate galactose phosphotransferase
MRVDADRVLKDILEQDPVARAEWEKDFKLRNDPRVTRIGRFLRQSSMDELAQLINVVRGEMSLVGPRPIVSEEIGRYGTSFRYYLQCRPGITGPWQVSGRNDLSYADRVALDVWYSQNKSIPRDVIILFQTFFVVMSRKGAY